MQQLLIQILNLNITSHPLMKIVNFWSVFLLLFLDRRSTKLLGLFSGNLPAMFFLIDLLWN